MVIFWLSFEVLPLCLYRCLHTYVLYSGCCQVLRVWQYLGCYCKILRCACTVDMYHMVLSRTVVQLYSTVVPSCSRVGTTLLPAGTCATVLPSTPALWQYSSFLFSFQYNTTCTTTVLLYPPIQHFDNALYTTQSTVLSCSHFTTLCSTIHFSCWVIPHACTFLLSISPLCFVLLFLLGGLQQRVVCASFSCWGVLMEYLLHLLACFDWVCETICH